MLAATVWRYGPLRNATPLLWSPINRLVKEFIAYSGLSSEKKKGEATREQRGHKGRSVSGERSLDEGDP